MSIKTNKVYFMIYLSHALSAWGDRMWDFAVGLYMVILYPDSLLLTAILGFAVSLAVISLGSPLGSWIDKTHRIKSATASIITQNCAVAIASAALAFTFAFKDDIQLEWNGTLQILIYVFVIFMSVIAKLASVASDIAIERDWIVVLTSGDESGLANMNSIMRTIDLTTKILAPAAIGFLITYLSEMFGAIFIATWNMFSGVAEVYLLLLIYRRVPQLGHKEDLNTNSFKQNKSFLQECMGGWRQYLEHPIKWAGIGFSCLFMTVLGFDQITTGYIYSQGVGEDFIGIITSAGAITGIVGSVSYPFLRKCLGKNPTALLGYALNTSCLLLCVISIFMPGSPFEPKAILNPFGMSNSTKPAIDHETVSMSQLWEQRQNIFYFVGGIVFSRFGILPTKCFAFVGLWIADLSIAQLFQDSVEESRRGVINGVQNSMNQSMDLLKFFLVIVLPSSQTYGYLIILTWIFGSIGWILHFIFSLRLRRQSDKKQWLSSMDQGNPEVIEAMSESTPLLPSK